MPDLFTWIPSTVSHRSQDTWVGLALLPHLRPTHQRTVAPFDSRSTQAGARTSAGSRLTNLGDSRATFGNATPAVSRTLAEVPDFKESGRTRGSFRLSLPQPKASGEADCITSRSAGPPHTLHAGLIGVGPRSSTRCLGPPGPKYAVILDGAHASQQSARGGFGGRDPHVTGRARPLCHIIPVGLAGPK